MSKHLILIVMVATLGRLAAASDPLPAGFVYVEDVVPNVELDLRYCSERNFVGDKIDGYLRPKCILSEAAATALHKVQQELLPFGLGLKIFDAYRPQRAVDHFLRWAKMTPDTRMKAEYYPRVDKANLVAEGYIAAKSGHSRGSTVDLTLIARNGDQVQELDMGTKFDFFGKESWVQHPELSPKQRANRLLLKLVMEKHGFKSYGKEWWHFTLRNEPFPETYFDFLVQ